MKTIIIDWREDKIIQTISFKKGLVIVHRKKESLCTRMFLFFIFCLSFCMICMVCYIENILLSTIFSTDELSNLNKCYIFVLILVFLCSMIPAFIACCISHSLIFDFRVIIMRHHNTILYHLQNGFIDFKRKIYEHNFIEIKKHHHRGDWTCYAYISGNKINSFLFIPVMPLIATKNPGMIKKKSVIIEKIVYNYLTLHVKNNIVKVLPPKI